MHDITHDSEDHWEWVIGDLAGAKVDITRTHKVPRKQADTRLFLLNGENRREYSVDMIVRIVSRLSAFIEGKITCGRWDYRSGNEYDLVTIREFEPARIDG